MKGWGISMGFAEEVKYYDLFHLSKNYEAEAKEIRRKFPKAKYVLEIGCGTGNLTIELEKLGFFVTCIEPSKEMLKYFKGTGGAFPVTIQDFIPPEDKFDLVLAMYDVLNYIPETEIDAVVLKIMDIGKRWHTEVWNKKKPVKPFTYKKANGCHRVRLGFRFKNAVHLWFIFWGKGLVISKHKLYL